MRLLVPRRSSGTRGLRLTSAFGLLRHHLFIGRLQPFACTWAGSTLRLTCACARLFLAHREILLQRILGRYRDKAEQAAFHSIWLKLPTSARTEKIMLSRRFPKTAARRRPAGSVSQASQRSGSCDLRWRLAAPDATSAAPSPRAGSGTGRPPSSKSIANSRTRSRR